MKDKLWEFGAYCKSRELFELVLEDMSKLKNDIRAKPLIYQQVSSADSICSNIEEGYGRGGTKEYLQFLRIARGSARETLGRYDRMKPWLGDEIVAQRTGLCNEIISILVATIKNLQARGGHHAT
ncbi:MAG: four helix bundle protein [Candidatus Tritonobacter lacicola]|nr:four helix bundle protein [Candidatus Tritonobacter lacicola]